MTIIALLLTLILISLVFGGDAVISLLQLIMKIGIFIIFAIILIFIMGLVFV